MGGAMARSRIVRLLRIAVSAMFGILCLLLIALWVRSYSHYDMTLAPLGPKRLLQVISCHGQFYFGTAPIEHLDGFPKRLYWIPRSGPRENMPRFTQDMSTFLGVVYWRIRPKRQEKQFAIPYWMLTCLSGLLAVGVALKRSWRYSLRTLLLGMMLVAVLLGLAMRML
jgi:hypothetical protein